MIQSLSDDVSEQLLAMGWAKIPASANAEPLDAGLIAMANALGKPVGCRAGRILVESLRPTIKERAKPSSLSRQYSTGTFPLHADTAHWTTPCRYVVLGCADSGGADRATLLLDTSDLPFEDRERDRLYSTPFRVTNGRRSFFSTILSKKRPYIRLDPGCMSPVTPAGAQALATLSKDKWATEVVRFQWSINDILIIDNWRVLHGRVASSEKDDTRELHRILIQ